MAALRIEHGKRRRTCGRELSLGSAGANGELPCRPCCQRCERCPGSQDDCDRKSLCQTLPVAPTMERQKIIASHQPYKKNVREALLQSHHGVDRVTRPQLSLDVGYAQTRMPSNNLARGRHPPLQ